jgi:hypothetical protein
MLFVVQGCKLFRIFVIFHLWYWLTNLTYLPKLNHISCQRNPQEKEIPFCFFLDSVLQPRKILCICTYSYAYVLQGIVPYYQIS